MQKLDIIDFFGKPVKIDASWVGSTCKYNEGAKQCIYLSVGDDGFYCVKNTPLKKVIGREFEALLVNKPDLNLAEGDNCVGFNSYGNMSEEEEFGLAY